MSIIIHEPSSFAHFARLLGNYSCLYTRCFRDIHSVNLNSIQFRQPAAATTEEQQQQPAALSGARMFVAALQVRPTQTASSCCLLSPCLSRAWHTIVFHRYESSTRVSIRFLQWAHGQNQQLESDAMSGGAAAAGAAAAVVVERAGATFCETQQQQQQRHEHAVSELSS
jgi:hypothetical protein